MRPIILLALAAGTAVAQTSLTETRLATESDVTYLTFTDDSETLVVATQAGLEFFDVGSGEPDELRFGPILEVAPGLPPGSAVLEVQNLSPDDVIYRAPTGVVQRPRFGAISPDGRLIARSTMETRELEILDVENGEPRFSTPSGLGAAAEVKFSPDGRLLVAAYGDTDIRIWEVEDGRLVHVIDELDLMTGSIRFSPDGSRLYTGGVDGFVRVWDTATWKQVRQFATPHPESIVNVFVSDDDELLLTSGFDAATVLNPAHIVLWDAEDEDELARIRVPHEPVAVSMSPDGRTIAVAEGDAPEVRLLRVSD